MVGSDALGFFYKNGDDEGKRDKRMALFVFFHSFLELQLRLRSFLFVVVADACERYTGMLLRFNKAVGRYR